MCLNLPLNTKEPWCVNLLSVIILAGFRVQQVSQVSQALKDQQGVQEAMEMRAHQDHQVPVVTRGLRCSNHSL